MLGVGFLKVQFYENKVKVGCLFFCLTPKNDWKGMKKEGEMHIFPPIGKKNIFFFPINLKFTKLQKNA